MTSLRRRMLKALHLRGLAPKTQQCYLEAVKHLAEYYRGSPDQLSEEEIRQGLTLPQELHTLVRRHQQDLYNVLRRAAAQARITLPLDPH